MVAIIGALSGLLTQFIPDIFGFLRRHQEHKQEIERLKISANIEIYKADMLLQQEYVRADASTVTGAQRSESKLSTSQWVEDLRGLVRPIITLGAYAVFFSILLFRIELPAQTLVILEGMLSLVTGFWFGGRIRSRSTGLKP